MPPGTSRVPEGVSPFFYPPRASQTPRWKRALLRLEGLRERLPTLRDPDLAAAASLIPGLGHLLLEKKPGKAALMFCGYWLVLLWTSLFSELDLWICSMSVFSLHQWIMIDAYRRARAALALPALRGRQLAVFSLVTGLALGIAYRQAGQAISGYGTIVRLKTSRFEPLLSEGDRLVIIRQTAYHRGDIVYSPEHERLERVVGEPGDQISIIDHALLLNGAPMAKGEEPLGAPNMEALEGGSLQVPAGAYCVFFTSQSRILRGNRLLDFFMIPAKEIDGRLSLRYTPDWKRFR